MSDADEVTGRRPDRSGVTSYSRWFTTTVVAGCFWTAIVLPFLYMPLLITGLETQSEGLAFVTLLGVNLVMLLAGHSYHSN